MRVRFSDKRKSKLALVVTNGILIRMKALLVE